MSKVFAVSSGSYSDYSVLAIFSTKANAEKYMANMRAHSDSCYRASGLNDIEEYELDAALAETEYDRYSVGIMLDDGSIKESYGPQKSWGIPKATSYIAEKVPCYENRGIARATSPKSLEHAKKVAIEARQKWLRERP